MSVNLGELKRKRRTWSELKSLVELSRKLVYSIKNDSPNSVNFRQYKTPDTNETLYRAYFLGSTKKGDITLKYVDLKPNCAQEKIQGTPVFTVPNFSPNNDKQQLTKEEQLLRERMRCSFSGITSYSLEPKSGRLVFSERSELFYLDDNIQNNEANIPMEIRTESKGAIDIQICPLNPDLISYILNDNIWVKNVRTNENYELTCTLDPVKSGSPSYAVQEEFNRYTGYWWQPVQQLNSDNSVTYRIVYEEVDDCDVELTYITPACTDQFGYDMYRYPRVGTPNSRVYLKMVEINISEDQHNVKIVRKNMCKDFYQLFDWYEYLVRGEWTSDGQYFCAQIFNRLQTRCARLLIPMDYFEPELCDESAMQVSAYSASSIYLLYEQISDTWINSNDYLYFFNEGSKKMSFITANEETGFMHLYHYKISLENENLVSFSDEKSSDVLKCVSVERVQLTEGEWCVDQDQNVRVDEQNHLVYFTAFKDPIESQLFVVNYLEPLKIRKLTKSGFSHSIVMNKEANIFICISSNLSVSPTTFMYQINNQEQGLESISITQLAQLANEDSSSNKFFLKINESYTSVFSSVLNINIDSHFSSGLDDANLVQTLFKPPQIFTFLTEDNCKLYGMIYMPLNYESGVKYPTLLYVYAGPKAQMVSNSYKGNKFSRFNTLAMLGYCVVAVDSRGSDHRGLSFESHLKRKMGTVEIADQVRGLEAAASIFNCIDMSRVGIHGWSYGGYASLLALAQRPDIFKVAISGAPVTSWHLYDTAYTERYMGLPDEEKDAYQKGSVLNLAKQFPDEENRLLIIHGLIDENVHFIHTRQFIDALVKENKPYQLQIYPNERHGIRSPDASVHFDINFYSFLEQNL